MQEDGLPISGELLSGNTSDKNWNPRTVEELSDMLSKNGYKDVTFVADSATISTESILRFAKRDIQFISRLPETFNLAKELKTNAWEENSWEDIGTCVPHQKKAYKNQDKVERGFKFLKQPQYLGPIYTKIQSRVEALGYIFLIVLLVAKCLELIVRVGM